jgi:antitoxin (DNA-binding transcriptional repressor) of toxin-antitoxin stability system
MSHVNVHEAKMHLSTLLTRVAAGEEIVISKAMIERIPIMTVDPQFEPYNVKLLWGNQEGDGSPA